MGARLLCLALLVVSSLHAGRSAAQAPLFLLDTDEASYVSLFRVEPATGQLTALGALPTDLGQIVALAAATENLLYAVARGGDVLEITASPFGFTSLGNVGPNFVSGLAFSDGGLYAIDEVTSSLYRIELAPVSIALVGAVRFLDGTPLGIGGGDLAQDGNGDWFLWTNATQALYRLDVATAVATPVPAQVAGLGFLTGLAFDFGSGALVGSSGLLDALQTLDAASGQTQASVGFCLNCPTPYDVGFGDLASPAGEPCPLSKDFWKANPNAWPVDALLLGTRSYAQAALLDLLSRPVRGDASVQLARELISAKLNVLAGFDPEPVAAAIASADALIASFPGPLPFGVKTSSALGRTMGVQTDTLGGYNEGELTPFCVR